MTRALATLMIGAIVVAAGYVTHTEAAQQPGAAGTTRTAKTVVPPPVAVKVIAVDPKANTITVRDIAAVPETPDTKAIEVTLPVTANATGQKLADTKAGETVGVTCEVKRTVQPQAAVPIVLTDCVRVIKIEPKS
jgi:hypothetical protein